MKTDIWTPSFLRDLTDSQLSDFQAIVLKDVKNKFDNEDGRKILVRNLDLWLYSLQILRREIELQLSQHKTNLQIRLADLRKSGALSTDLEEAKLNEQRWRNNAMKFLTAIERKTLYVKLLLAEEEDDEDLN
jgi:hypothetical protein